MRKDEYIEELREKLRGLSKEDMEDAVSYCEEYFEDAGIENEHSVIEELGAPSKYAAQIRAEYAIRYNQEDMRKGNPSKNPRTSMKNTIVIFLGTCALPLALPLGLAAIALFFAFILLIGTLLVAAVMIVLAFFITGIPLLISGVTNISTPGNALIAFGGGFIAIGVSLLLLLALVSSVGYLIPAFSRMITKIYARAKKGAKRYEKA